MAGDAEYVVYGQIHPRARVSGGGPFVTCLLQDNFLADFKRDLGRRYRADGDGAGIMVYGQIAPNGGGAGAVPVVMAVYTTLDSPWGFRLSCFYSHQAGTRQPVSQN